MVRLPSENEVVPSAQVLPGVNGILYAGIDRCAWDDLYDEAYYMGKAPPEVASIAKGMQDDCVDFSGIKLVRDFNVTRGLLEYSNRTAARNEIIAIRSEQLDEAKGNFDTGVAIEWLGIDVVSEGEWSLVAGGLFAAAEHFQPWIRRVNRSGLFDTPQAASEYERAYQTAVALGHAEELAAPSAGFRILQVQVGRVAPW